MTTDLANGDFNVWQCRTCGYLYDEESGDIVQGIAPETRMSEFPNDWVCPFCGTSHDDFDIVEM